MIIQMEFTKLYKINLDHGEALKQNLNWKSNVENTCFN